MNSLKALNVALREESNMWKGSGEMCTGVQKQIPETYIRLCLNSVTHNNLKGFLLQDWISSGPEIVCEWVCLQSSVFILHSCHIGQHRSVCGLNFDSSFETLILILPLPPSLSPTICIRSRPNNNINIIRHWRVMLHRHNQIPYMD